MALEARLRIRHAGCFTCELGPGMSVAQLSDEGEHSVFLASGESAETVELALEGLRGTLVKYRLVTRSSLTAVALGACPPHGVENVIRSYNCSILWPAVFADGHERYRVLAPSRERLKQLVSRLAEMGGANVESLVDADAATLNTSLSASAVFGDLTPRQLDVLRAAVQQGYYASPRRTSTEALAVEFGVARATFEEHLRKAEVKVLGSMLASFADHPTARAALKRNARAKSKARA